jgi:predicted dehydrogenase
MGKEFMLRVGIVGCGLIGNKRARVIKEDPEACLCAVSDVDVLRAEEMLSTGQ